MWVHCAHEVKAGKITQMLFCAQHMYTVFGGATCSCVHCTAHDLVAHAVRVCCSLQFDEAAGQQPPQRKRQRQALASDDEEGDEGGAAAEGLAAAEAGAVNGTQEHEDVDVDDLF